MAGVWNQAPAISRCDDLVFSQAHAHLHFHGKRLRRELFPSPPRQNGRRAN